MDKREWGRRRSDNQPYPKTRGKEELPKGTMFAKPKYAYLADIVSLENPEKARVSVKKLIEHFDSAKTRTKKIRILRATVLAKNRAATQLKRKHLSAKERQEFKDISRIYDGAALGMRMSLKEGNPHDSPWPKGFPPVTSLKKERMKRVSPELRDKRGHASIRHLPEGLAVNYRYLSSKTGTWVKRTGVSGERLAVPMTAEMVQVRQKGRWKTLSPDEWSNQPHGLWYSAGTSEKMTRRDFARR